MIALTVGQSDSLETNLCYSLMSLHEFGFKGKNYRLIKLRNQWGHDEWNGAWSEQSSIWNK